MKKKIYVVTYVSCYDELYTENKTSTDREQADKDFLNYIKDIHESENYEFHLDEDEHKGRCVFKHVAPNGHLYLVKLTEHNIGVTLNVLD